MTAMITKGEREDLQRLVRQREKVLKSAAKQRSSELIADFENQLGAIYAFDNDATWAAAVKAAKAEVEAGQQDDRGPVGGTGDFEGLRAERRVSLVRTRL